MEEFFEELAGVVLVAPVADVGEVEGGFSKVEDLQDVADIFAAVAAFRPTELGDDDVLGGREPDGFSLEVDLLASLKTVPEKPAGASAVIWSVKDCSSTPPRPSVTCRTTASFGKRCANKR